jgi:ClpP class serine protease
LITEAGLETIVGIAQRQDVEGWRNVVDPEAVSVKIGTPLMNATSVTVRDRFAIIPIVGPIFRRANLFTDMSGAVSTSALARDLRIADEEPEADQIILKIDSPGGQATGIAEAAELIKRARKRVIAYVDGMGASAAYWLAAAADEIVVNKTAEVGSIGTVFSARINNSNNTVTIVSRQSPKKRLEPGTEEGNKQLQERADNLASVFIEDVAEFRGVTVEKVLSDFGQGGLLLGQAAVDAGMADRVGTFEEIIEGVDFMAVEKDVTAASLRADYPEACEAVTKEAREAAYNEGLLKGREEGRQAEVSRIQGVKAQSIPGHEALIEGLMFDGVSTGADAAMKIVEAEKSLRANALEKFKASAPEPVTTPPVQEQAPKDDNLTAEEKIEADWKADASLREEFGGSFESYKAFKSNEHNVTIRGGVQ